jgi:hypothetical protein
MRIKHKTARDTAISTIGGRFEVDSEGFLNPTPTMAQWHQFSTAQAFFTVHGDIPVEAAPVTRSTAVAEPVAPSSTVWAPPQVVASPSKAIVIADVEVGEDDSDDEGDEDEDSKSFSDDTDDLDNAETPDPVAYATMTFDELKAAARQRGIKVLRVSKVDLISLLNAHDLGV